MGVRYYDPIAGRFISRDPLGDDVNDYACCDGNPVQRADPDGLSYWSDVGNVFKGYGDAIVGVVNPVGWYHGVKAIYRVARKQGIRRAAGAVWQGTKQSFTAWTTTNNPREFGRSFGNVLITAAAIAAPYAKAGSLAKAGEIAEQVGGRATALAKKCHISDHAIQQMAERGITERMITVALRKGKPFWDPKNKVVNYVLQGGYASGKDLLVGYNPLTGRVTTAIRGSNLVRPRFRLLQ